MGTTFPNSRIVGYELSEEGFAFGQPPRDLDAGADHNARGDRAAIGHHLARTAATMTMEMTR